MDCYILTNYSNSSCWISYSVTNIMIIIDFDTRLFNNNMFQLNQVTFLDLEHYKKIKHPFSFTLIYSVYNRKNK